MNEIILKLSIRIFARQHMLYCLVPYIVIIAVGLTTYGNLSLIYWQAQISANLRIATQPYFLTISLIQLSQQVVAFMIALELKKLFDEFGINLIAIPDADKPFLSAKVICAGASFSLCVITGFALSLIVIVGSVKFNEGFSVLLFFLMILIIYSLPFLTLFTLVALGSLLNNTFKIISSCIVIFSIIFSHLFWIIGLIAD